MAIAVDGSTPAFWTGTPTVGFGITSSSFTAPASAALVVLAFADDNTVNDEILTISDSGTLSWTTQVKRGTLETSTGGASYIFTAITSSSVSRTVTVTVSSGTDSKPIHAKCYVLTGVDTGGTPFDSITANNEGGSSTNNLTTTSITPGADGLLLVADNEWAELGAVTSSDLTIESTHYTGAMWVATGYKTCTSGVGVTANLDAGGSGSAHHKWCQIIARAAAGAAANTPGIRDTLQAVNRASTF